MDQIHNHKHNFRFAGVEDFFLYQQLRWVCRSCFIECVVERSEYYSILTEDPRGVDRT